MTTATRTDFTEFFEAYVEAALWSSCDDHDVPLDKNYRMENIDTETCLGLIDEARKFYDAHCADFDDDITRAGHDFWLSRNGHGTGFWDSVWSDSVGGTLHAAAEKCGEIYLYVGDDGFIHSS